MDSLIKGTKTEQNLLKAFAGESQARNKYTYFSSVAKKEGFIQIFNIFLETAENEKEHAKIFFKYLEGGQLEISASYAAGTIKDTKSNLEEAADGENMEWTSIYSDFSNIAKEEGFHEIAQSFYEISQVEKFHETRYRQLIRNIAYNEAFKKKVVVKWHCINCGYVFDGVAAPMECPACRHPQAYYELLSENY